jgi:dTDP-4-dehydrorhamnose reductase
MEQVKKVIIIGSKGMAGHVMFEYLNENTNYEVIGIARGNDFYIPKYDLDITDFKKLKNVLIDEEPDIVINCIGILNKDAEDHPDNAILLNSYFPHFLAGIGKDISFKVIHVSTDCVFNGKKGGYKEDSIKDGFGIYAQSKALGEINYGNNLTLRTSIIGPELKLSGIGLFHWFMQQKGKIKGYSEAYWTGVTTIELAKAVYAAIEQDITGLHHLVNDSKINKFDLTNLFKTVFVRNDVSIEAYEAYKVDKSLIRTNYSFDYSVPSYEKMIKEMKQWIRDHKELYNYNA